MTIHLGDVSAGSTLYIPFDSYSAAGASVTLTGLAVTDIEIYKNGSVTQRSSDAGYALLDTDGIDFDGIAGIHGFSINLSDNTDAGFYVAGSFYWVVISAVTIDSQTVNFVAATFRICAAEAVAGVPVTDVTHAAGTAWNSGAIGATTIATGAIDADALAADAGTELGTAVWATTTRTLSAGAVTTATFAAGAIDAAAIAANAITSSEFADGTITAAKFAAGAITAAVIATDAIDDDAIATGAIASTAFAAGAIDAAAIAANAIGASELAADAVAEIADGVWDEVTTGHVTTGTFGERLFPLRASTATAGASGSITLDAGASSIDEFYTNALIVTTGGTGPNQARTISAYVGSTRVATITPAWVTNPASGTTFVIIPAGFVSGAAAPTAAQVADAVWDEDATAHQTTGTFGQAIGDPVADTNTIFKATVTDATGVTVGTDTASMLAAGNPVSAGGITTASFAAGAINAAAIAADAIGASELAADAATEIGTAVWATGTRSLTLLDEDSTTLDLDATIRSAVGLASANLDTQLDALPTAAENTTAALTTQMTQSYAADGTAPTVAQALFLIQQMLGDFAISGTTLTVKQLNGSSTAATFTLDSATTPTSITRAT